VDFLGFTHLNYYSNVDVSGASEINFITGDVNSRGVMHDDV
jgi:hypothetical protein